MQPYFFALTGLIYASAFSTPANPTNIALSGIASASGFWEGNPLFQPSRVIDGSTFDGDAGGRYWILPNENAGWWQVDLRKQFNIGLIEILNSNNAIANDRATKDFRIEILDSARNVLFSKSDILPFTSYSSASNPTKPYSLNLDKAVRGRYVKIYVTSWYPIRTDPSWPFPFIGSSNPSNQGCGLNEVRVFTTDGKPNSAPSISPIGSGIYEIGTKVVLGGTGSDLEGDMISYSWNLGVGPICRGEIITVPGGQPVALAPCNLSSLALGTHVATLEYSDGFHPLNSKTLMIEIVDRTKPTLAPIADKKILSPPNHKLIPVVIQTNVTDNGGTAILSAKISSNEAEEGLGDGDMPVDWTQPVIDPIKGTINFNLRSERSGKGSGRIYSIQVTAMDPSGNSTSAVVSVMVPKGRSKQLDYNFSASGRVEASKENKQFKVKPHRFLVNPFRRH
jgi:F5/8 type C domain